MNVRNANKIIMDLLLFRANFISQAIKETSLLCSKFNVHTGVYEPYIVYLKELVEAINSVSNKYLKTMKYLISLHSSPNKSCEQKKKNPYFLKSFEKFKNYYAAFNKKSNEENKSKHEEALESFNEFLKIEGIKQNSEFEKYKSVLFQWAEMEVGNLKDLQKLFSTFLEKLEGHPLNFCVKTTKDNLALTVKTPNTSMDSDFCFQKKAEMENKSIVDPRLSNNGRRVLENSESCESGSSSSGDMDEGKKIIMVKIQPVSELPTKKEVGDSEAYYLNFDYPEPNKVLPTRAHRSLYRTKPQKRSDKLSSYLPHQMVSFQLSSGSVSLEKKLPLCYRLDIMEGVNVYFKGNDLGEVLIEGKVYFSTSITVMNSWSQENESIILKLHHFEKLDTVVGNPAIFNGDLKDIVVEDKLLLGCNKISEALKKHGTIRESDATVDLFCYQMKETSYRRVPLLVYTLWDCQQRSTSLELYIKHNEDAVQVPLNSLVIFVKLNEHATKCEDFSNGRWSSEEQLLIWAKPSVEPYQYAAKFKAVWQVEQKSTGRVYVRFSGDGSTLSPFALENGNGHIASCSDIVKRFYADKYFMSF